MNTRQTPRSDKELWRSLAIQPPAVPVCGPAAVSDMDLAAWLEGRLTEEAAAPVEAAVAADPALRRAALDLAVRCRFFGGTIQAFGSDAEQGVIDQG